MKSIIRIIMITLLVSFMSVSSMANTSLTEDQKKALTVVSIKSYPVKTDMKKLNEILAKNPNAGLNALTPLEDISIIIDGIMAIGKKIWTVVDAGRPVVDVKLAPTVSIVPYLETEKGVLTEMANWSMPKVSSVRVVLTNALGMDVVKYTYTLIFQYNGSHKGVGKYVTNLRIIPTDINVKWGYTFDAVSELVGISNVGSAETPVASGIINVGYSSKTAINETRATDTIYVDGLGNSQVINGQE